MLTEDVFGADVAVVALDDGFDGLAASSAEAKLIVLGTSQVPGAAAVHARARAGSSARGRRPGASILTRTSTTGHRRRTPARQRANSFASAFLMPERRPARRRRDRTGSPEPAFAALACDLKVSPSALAFRLSRLRLIDSGTCDRYKAIAAAKAAAIAGRGDELRPAGRPGELRYARRGCSSATRTRPTSRAPTTLRPYANLLGVDVDELRRALESEQGVYDAP